MNGSSIGHYKILEVLGQGGMATVYKAFDTKEKRDVAIKIIRKDAFPDEIKQRLLQRFDLESRVLSRLSHNNIIKMYEFGQFQDSPFMEMEYVDGKTLKEFPKPISLELAINIILPVANSLKHAHLKKILHRDIKPSNILIDSSGQPKLADFGIAKILENYDGQTLTATGVGIGTPEYMAPEQALGKEVDGRADVYSLGIVLFELLTGIRPYLADTPMAIMMKHLNNPIPKLSEYNKDLPLQLENIITKALAKDPKDRFPNIDALISAIQQIHEITYDPSQTLDELQTLLTVENSKELKNFISGSVYQDQKFKKNSSNQNSSYPLSKVSKTKSNFSLYSLGIILIGIMLLAGLLLIFKSLSLPQKQTVENMASQITNAITNNPTQNQAQTTTETSESLPRNFTPERATYPPDVIQINNIQGLTEIGNWETFNNYLTSVSWREDNKSFFISDFGYGFEQYDLSTLKFTGFKEDMRNIYMTGFSPDGLTYITRNREATQFDIWDIDNDRIKISITGNNGFEMASPKISPDGNFLAGLLDYTLKIWDTNNGQPIYTLEEFLTNDPWEGSYEIFEFSPDSKYLATGIPLTGEIKIFDMDNGTHISTIQWHEFLKSIAFSPDGKKLASGSNDVNSRDIIRIWDVASGDLISAIQKSNENVTSMVYTLDGETIISGSSNGTVRIWRTSDSSLLRTLYSSAGEISCLSISHDGKFLVSVGSEVILWGIKYE